MSNENRFFDFIYLIFPLLNQVFKNSKINKSIEYLREKSTPSDYVLKFKNASMKDAVTLREQTLSDRTSLTDKAKVNAIGITLAVSLIFGMTQLLFSINSISTNKSLFLLIIILSSLSLIYFLISGLVSLKALIGTEVFHLLENDFQYLATIKNKKSRINQKKLLIIRNNELNIKINLKLNNYLSSSYSNIRNGLSILTITSLLVFISVYNSNSNNGQAVNLHYIDTLSVVRIDTIKTKSDPVNNIFSKDKSRLEKQKSPNK